MLDARAVALQGIGFGAMPTALQGFAPVRVSAVVGGGSGAAGVANYKLPRANIFEDEEHIRAEIIREDEEVLAVIMSAVTSGALKWLH